MLWQNIVVRDRRQGACSSALTFAGVASLWVAVLADMGASLVVIANGLRLLRRPVLCRTSEVIGQVIVSRA